jgi:AraC-like ligand binding domain
MMRYSLEDLPIVFAELGIVTREAAMGEFDVTHEVLPANLDLAPLFKGLPDDRCPCAHWGYLLHGRVRVQYRDREEIIRAGDCFYMEPGHLPIFEEESEWIVFSPRGAHQVTADAVRRNKAMLQT